MSNPAGWDDDMAVIRQAMGDAMNARKVDVDLIDQVTSDTAREWLYGAVIEKVLSNRTLCGVDGDQLYSQHEYSHGFVGRYQGASGRGK